MKNSALIKKIIKTNKTININWNDGKKSKFHFIWLRDNCPEGVHPTARQRTFNFLKVSKKIHPKNYSVTKNKKLKIIWSEGNHVSYYDLNWLKKNCYTIKNKKPYKSPYILWKKNLCQNLDKICLDYNYVVSSSEGLKKWLELLNIYGLSIIQKAPTRKNSALKILNKISHIRETFFGTPFDVINIPNPNNTAYTADGLRNHTDLPYYEYAPGYQFLHCLTNDARGGLSLAVDGFSVANYLREKEPSIFKTLINTHIKFKDNDYTQKTIRIFYSPLITLNKDKDFNDIRFSVATMAAIDCSPRNIEKFYSAYRKFGELIHDNKFIVKFRLNTGDIFCFNNRRVLHGRTAFDPNSGHRHLQGYYMDRDDILGRLNYLNKVEV